MRRRRIGLAGHEWRIVEIADVAARARELGHEDVRRKDVLDGFCSYEEREIAIASSLRPRRKAATLFHEMLHAVAPELDEHVVRRVEDALGRVLWRQGWRPLKERGEGIL